MKKLTASIFSAVLMLSMVFSSSVFAANDATSTKASAWESFLGLFSKTTATATTANVQYRGHVQDYGDVPTNGTWVQEDNQLGTTGESKRIEGFKIELTDGNTLPAGTQIRYNVHVENEGWLHDKNDIVNTGSWEKDGAFAGSVAKSQRVEAIEIVLTDANGVKLQGYSVQYMVHGEDYGWSQGWVADGAIAGTEGQSKRLEAIRIKIVQVKADLTEYNAALAKVAQADYTTASWTTYQAVVNANKVTEDNTQAQVDTATANITAAQKNLVLVPKVTSVTAVNANQLQVTFSTPIKASSIISNTTTGALVNSGTGYFSIARSAADASYANKSVVSFQAGFLSADGKTLTLTATASTYFDGTYSFTATDKVLTTDSQKLTPYSGTFTAAATVAPTVTGLAYNTISGGIEATFSEPLVAVPSIIRVNGTPITTVATFVGNTNNTKITFAKPADVAAGSTATVYLAGATDYALNQLTGYTGSVAITSDTTALAVQSMTQSASNQIKVVFNKSIASTNSAVDTATTVLMDGTAISAGNVVVTKDTTDTENKTFIITLTNGSAAPTYFYGTASTKTMVVTFAANQITDVFGQKLATTTNTVDMTKDTVGPVAQAIRVSDDGTKFEVTFDEKIAASGTTSNIVLRKDGVAMSATNSATQKAATGDDSKVLVIGPAATDLTGGTLSGAIKAGTYQVRLNASAIADPNTNANTAQTLTITVSGTADKLTATIANVAGPTANKFTVSFDKDVTTASALSLSNYTLDGQALPATTDIYFTTAARVVEIDLPAETVNVSASGSATDASLAVSNVVTSAGLAVTPVSANVKVLDNTKPILQSATVLDNKTIELTYNEAMGTVSGALVGDEFTVKQAGTAISLAASELTATNVSGYPNKVRLTVNKAATGETLPSAVTTDGGLSIGFGAGTGDTLNGATFILGTIADGTATSASYDAATNRFTINGDFTTAGGSLATTSAIQAALRAATGAPTGAAYITVSGTVVEFTGTPTASAAVSGGVTAVPATTLNLNQTTTVTTVTPVSAAIVDLANNAQKVDITVTAN